MLLAIDCGNTNTIFSIWDGNEFIFNLADGPLIIREQLINILFGYLHSCHYKNIKADISDVIISSTVPRVVFNLRVLSDRLFSIRVQLLLENRIVKYP